jgi:rhamnogalacturonyl hydrolase YesR
MRKAQIFTVMLIIILSAFSCQTKKKMARSFIQQNVNTIVQQYELQTEIIESSGKVLNPRTFIDGKIVYVQPEDWTSGFFPGSMWYLYELTGDAKWKELGIKYTEALDSVKFLTSHHDVGFMIGSSFGNGLRLSENEAYKDVIVQAARSLSTRFRPEAGIIQSWDTDRGWQAQRGWECPVIIDNMMNLELLFNATKFSGDSSFYRIAVTHADNTIRHQFRPDYSTWHVVDYSLAGGRVRNKHTAQGFAHHTTWARGQSWGIYGFVVCYRETGDEKYLQQAEKAFEYVISHINFPDDCIPYWDYDAPNIPFAHRDVSSAAILASALYEMSLYSKSDYYRSWADRIVENLSTPAYKAMVGENGNFILMHSVGSIPHGVEIDVPLNYADYYFLEALKRKRDLESDSKIKF